MAEIEFAWAKETPFTKPMKRAVLRDLRLSWAARGLFLFIWDLPSGWSCNRTHLINMAPDGRSRLAGLVKELAKIGAITISHRRLTAEDVAQIDADANVPMMKKRYRAGQMAGWKWEIHHPDYWAVEAPLTSKSGLEPPLPKIEKPSNGKSEGGKSTVKVFQSDGSAIKERGRVGYPPSSLEVDQGTGIHHDPKNGRDARSLDEIRLFSIDKITQAVILARKKDDLDRAFPSAVLRLLRKSAAKELSHREPAWAKMDGDSMASSAAGMTIGGEYKRMGEENEESF